jgi:uncharacterized protein YxeA
MPFILILNHIYIYIYIYIYILIAFSFYKVKNIAWKSYNFFVKKTYYKQNEELHEKNILFQYNLNYYSSGKKIIIIFI